MSCGSTASWHEHSRLPHDDSPPAPRCYLATAHWNAGGVGQLTLDIDVFILIRQTVAEHLWLEAVVTV